MCWTTNIIMLMDVAGPKNQAIGSAVSNSMGYLISALTTYLAATVTTQQAFLWVVVCSILGLVLSYALSWGTPISCSVGPINYNNDVHGTRSILVRK